MYFSHVDDALLRPSFDEKGMDCPPSCSRKCIAVQLVSSIRATGDLPSYIVDCSGNLHRWSGIYSPTIFGRRQTKHVVLERSPLTSMLPIHSAVCLVFSSSWINQCPFIVSQHGFCRIPNYIVQQILTYLSAQSVASLARVQQACRDVCQKILFRNVKLDSVRQMMAFVEGLLMHVARSPDESTLKLVSWIEHIGIGWDVKSSQNRTGMDDLVLLYRFSTILPLLQNLKSFSYSVRQQNLFTPRGIFQRYIATVAPCSMRSITISVGCSPCLAFWQADTPYASTGML